MQTSAPIKSIKDQKFHISDKHSEAGWQMRKNASTFHPHKSLVTNRNGIKLTKMADNATNMWPLSWFSPLWQP
jgi:hypothetical protein